MARYLRNDAIIVHFWASFSETKQCGFTYGAEEQEKGDSFWGTRQRINHYYQRGR
nr:MAG TPA: hypothetical protein [Caudoviricetes sp.]